MQPTINWSQPQRQPLSGLMIALLKSFGSLLKGLWPFVLIAIFRSSDEEAKKSFFMFGVIAVVTGLVLLGSLINFFFFRFYIQQDELVIKKGWLKKKALTVPLQKIQAVHIEQGPLHQLLNIVKLSADTAGSNDTEVTIDALRKPMAEALRQRLSHNKVAEADAPLPTGPVPLFTLGEKDLLRLSLSANHIEAFFILLSFAVGIFENLRTVNQDWVDGAATWIPTGSLPVILFLVTTVMLTTLVISTTRVFFKYYDFTAYQTPSGMQLKSGLAGTRERFVAFQKIQFVSWRANWIRRRLNLWMLQYHTAGGDAVKEGVKTTVPITQKAFISLLVEPYHVLPSLDEQTAIRAHRAYIWRRTILTGVIPAVVLMSAAVYWWHYNVLFLLLWPLLVLWRSWLFQQKFKVYPFKEVLYIGRGAWSVENVLLKWNMVQTVTLSQSLYQQKKGLATVHLSTAADSIVIPYIPLYTAQQLLNYGLYKVEKEAETFF